jgi:hypothetical protein
VCILDKKVKFLWNHTIGLVKVQWTYYGSEDANWEHEDDMREEYLHIFEYLYCTCVYNALSTMHK